MAIIEKVPAVTALTALNPLGRQQCSQHMPAAFPTVTQITAAVTSKQRVDGHVDNQYLNIVFAWFHVSNTTLCHNKQRKM